MDRVSPQQHPPHHRCRHLPPPPQKHDTQLKHQYFPKHRSFGYNNLPEIRFKEIAKLRVRLFD